VNELPFVDSHMHFWDLSHDTVEYAWLQPGVPHPALGDIEGLKARRYATEEYVADTRFNNVIKSVHTQVATTADPVEETRWLQSLADKSGFPHGIVAYCDLAADDAAETIERHMEFANVRGIRDGGNDDSFIDPAWRRGYQALAKHELVFTHQVGLDRMPKACDLIGAIPEVVFCVDHAGMPRERTQEYFDAWREGMESLAAYPNTVCKISALGMCDHRWTIDSLRPWVLACIDVFGVERSFFGSNFPVDRLFSTYTDLANGFNETVGDFSLDERRALFQTNAERVFRV
jgi:predicted TIM-barrel fold metal-dependent hydrolase